MSQSYKKLCTLNFFNSKEPPKEPPEKGLDVEKSEKEPAKEKVNDSFNSATLKTLLRECSNDKEDVNIPLENQNTPRKQNVIETNVDDIVSEESVEVNVEKGNIKFKFSTLLTQWV